MRILVVSKGSGSGTGASQASRYVARRKNDAERDQESEATRLFSAHSESLGDHRANLVLGAGSVPPTKDVFHLVISFAHEEDFLVLGADETERQAAVRELTRATLAAASANLQATDLRWVAGIHRNTANPHLHLLIHRDYHDRISGRAQRLQSMPSAWQVRWETTPTGERQTQPGALARTFENLLDERLQQRRSSPALVREMERTDDAMARLTAQHFLAAARLPAEQKRAASFAATRHLMRWEIPVKGADPNDFIKTTLAATERALRWESDQAKFIGSRQVHWDDGRRAVARLRVAELTAQREEILSSIAARQAEYDERMAVQQKLVKGLSTIHTREAERFKMAGRALPPARFTAAEMRMLDQLAQRRGEAAFYRTVAQLEREYDAQPRSTEPHLLAERTSRAFGRNVMAEIAQRAAHWQLQNFHEKRTQADVLLRTKDESQLTTARLSDVQPRSRLARAFPSLTTRSEPYQSVITALAEHEQRLTNEFTRATETRAVLHTVAQEYATEWQRQFPAQKLPPPRFLPNEQKQIAAYLDKETDPALRTRYAALLHEGSAAERRHEPFKNVREVGGKTAESHASAVFVYDSLTAALPALTAPAVARAERVERDSLLER